MNATNRKPLIPPCLKPGDTIGLAPLAGPWQEEPFAEGIRFLRDFGFKIKTLQHSSAKLPFLAAPDKQRAEILNELYKDPEVGAILACRGGYGCLRLLPLLDFGLFRELPAKLVIGFSDISALLNTISAESGLVTCHGPNLTTLAGASKKSQHAFLQMISSHPAEPLQSAPKEILQGGKASGQLVGGNLATLAHLLATPYEPDWRGKIVFLEDIGEAPYRIDRLLSQLALAGKLQEPTGLLLGSFTSCGDEEMIWQRVQELLPPKTPLWAGLPIGHDAENWSIPLGLPVEMDSNKGELTCQW